MYLNYQFRYLQKTTIISGDQYTNIYIGLNDNDSKTGYQVMVLNGNYMTTTNILINNIKQQIRKHCSEELKQIQEKASLKPDNERLYKKLFIVVTGVTPDPKWEGQTEK